MENWKLKEWLQGKGILNLTDLTEYLMEYPDEEDTPLYCLSDFIEQMPVTRESVGELKASWMFPGSHDGRRDGRIR